jgi:hypothetical protein
MHAEPHHEWWARFPTQVLHKSFYLIHPPMLVRVSKRLLPVPRKSWGLTVIDSGTPHTLVPVRVMALLRPLLADNAPPRLRSLFDPDVMCLPAPVEMIRSLISSGECDTGSFPTLELLMRDSEGQMFTLYWQPAGYLYSPLRPPRHHRQSSASPGGGGALPTGLGWLCAGVMASPIGGDKTVLGAYFMRSFYTVFDHDHGTVGLAPSSDCAAGLSLSSEVDQEVDGLWFWVEHRGVYGVVVVAVVVVIIGVQRAVCPSSRVAKRRWRRLFRCQIGTSYWGYQNGWWLR